MTTKLDLTGLKCPLPALLARKAIMRLQPGDRLEVHCTDPMAAIDIPAMVQQGGNHVVGEPERRGTTIIFLIEKRNCSIANRD